MYAKESSLRRSVWARVYHMRDIARGSLNPRSSKRGFKPSCKANFKTNLKIGPTARTIARKESTSASAGYRDQKRIGAAY